MSARASSFVRQERLWDRHMRMAKHGATEKNGVNRQALSPEEFAAWREIIGWARGIGLAALSDSAGNLFLRLQGTDAAAAPVLTGSHLDSQPTGGKFDGVYGVLAALEAVQAIVEAGGRPRRSIEVVAWMNEEGSRFAPGMMGSSAFSGAAPLEKFLPVRDAAGKSVGDCLAEQRARFPDLGLCELGRPVSAYVEAHIEQGPVLEKEGYSVGVVSGIQGKRTYRVTVHGVEAHCGTTPRRERKDALLSAVNIIHALAAEMRDAEDLVKFTVGKLDVMPNAPSVIPASAVFSIDLRHPDSPVLASLGDRIEKLCAANGEPCTVEVTELTSAASLSFPESMRDLVRAKATELGIPSLDIFSAAGHDARFLHGICEAGMIFVPCKDGISHNEAESAKPEDLTAGVRVLTEVLFSLAHR